LPAGTVIYARTMEFPNNLESEIMVIPRGMEFKSVTIPDVEGLTWTSKFSVVGYNSGAPSLTNYIQTMKNRATANKLNIQTAKHSTANEIHTNYQHTHASAI
jgi:penicillin V acylase-like amidase (Ntn superfamily)